MPSDQRAGLELLGQRVQSLLASGDVDAARGEAAAMRQLAARRRDSALLGIALIAQARVHGAVGEFAAALQPAEQAQRACARTRDPALRAQAQLTLATAQVRCGRATDALKTS